MTVVMLLGAATALLWVLSSAALERSCAERRVDLPRLEATFSAARFATLLGDGACASTIRDSFVRWDLVFPFAYGLFLCALYLWTERYRRFGYVANPPANGKEPPLPFVPTLRQDALVFAPLAAGVLDVLIENPALWLAARHLLSNPGGGAPAHIDAAVLIGSAGAVVKWLLIVFSVAGVLVELLSGPRGAILWRVRFSALAVLLGGVPLLAIPQGQDILQRLFERESRAASLFTAIPPLVFAAVAVWYCARKLMDLPLRNDGADQTGWYGFFAEQIPRLLGIALLGLVAAAFARAGMAGGRFALVAAGAFIIPLVMRRKYTHWLAAIGRPVLPPAWKDVPALPDRVGRLIVASVIACGMWFPGDAVPPDDAARDDARTIFYLRLAAYLCIVSAWLFQLLVRFRPEARRADRAGARGLRLAILAATATSAAWFVAFTAAPVTVGRFIGPLSVLTLATVNAVFIGSVCVWIGRRYGIPVVTSALLAALLFSLWNDNHAIRTLPGSAADVAGRPAMKDQFDEWVKGLGATGGEAGPPVILVAASGGGLRAAYWAAISLAAIQDRAPGFGRHLFAFSGVSGGSLGGALFAAILRDSTTNPQLACRPPDAGQERHAAMRGRYASCVRDYMHDDYLSPVLARLLVADFFQWFLPFPVRAFDRATALEYSWEDSYVRLTKQDTFRDGFARFTRDPGIRSTLPVLLLNTTHVETGRRYVESTVVRGGGGPAAHRMQDAGDVLDVLGIDIPLSTAIDNSARFTYISPAGHLDRGDGIEHGRVVDGGYFENSGLTTLRDVYDILTDNGKVPRSLYVLYLCNDPVTCAADDAPEREAIVPSIADELLSPVRALLHTRDARGSLARASLQDVVAPDRFLQLNVCNEAPPSATSVDPNQMDKAKQRIVSPPLGWLLSKLARDWMDASLAGAPAHDQSSCYARNAKAIAAIEAALKPPQ